MMFFVFLDRARTAKMNEERIYRWVFWLMVIVHALVIGSIIYMVKIGRI